MRSGSQKCSVYSYRTSRCFHCCGRRLPRCSVRDSCRYQTRLHGELNYATHRIDTYRRSTEKPAFQSPVYFREHNQMNGARQHKSHMLIHMLIGVSIFLFITSWIGVYEMLTRPDNKCEAYPVNGVEKPHNTLHRVTFLDPRQGNAAPKSSQ